VKTGVKGRLPLKTFSLVLNPALNLVLNPVLNLFQHCFSVFGKRENVAPDPSPHQVRGKLFGWVPALWRQKKVFAKKFTSAPNVPRGT